MFFMQIIKDLLPLHIHTLAFMILVAIRDGSVRLLISGISWLLIAIIHTVIESI